MSENGPNDLSERIAAAQRVQDERGGRKPDAAEQAGTSAGALALRYGAEFGACVAVGIGIGLLIDHFAGTEPWGLLIMLVFGFAAGIMSVIRAYRELTAEAQRMSNTDPVGSAEEEKKT